MVKEGQERRHHKRYMVKGLRARLREKYFLGLLSKPTSQEYPCLDISEGGLQFVAKHAVKPQSRLLLDLTISTTRNEPIRAKAQVIWFGLSNDLSFGRVGLKFISMSKQDYAELKKLIEKAGRDKSQVPVSIQVKALKEDSLFIRMQK